jgi:hypothetical protein
MMDIWEVAEVVDLDSTGRVAEVGGDEVTIYVQDWLEEAS